MRRFVIPFVLLCASAHAQVTLDMKALDQPETKPPAGAAHPKPAPRRVIGRPAPVASHAAPPKLSMPSAPPAVPVLAPVPPPQAAQPTPPPVLSPKSATTAAATAHGLRVAFAPGQSDLSPESGAAIDALAAETPKESDATFDVRAYAAGKPDDPSTPRRLSLARALSVRQALMARGVPSSHIYLRALGSVPDPDAPADRVDLTVSGANDTAK